MIKAHVYVGMTAWAAYGDTRWSAVRVLKVNREFVRVERVHPKTGAVVTRKGKARIAELLRRDPRLGGRDKPKTTPADQFCAERLARAAQAVAPAVAEVPAESPPASPPPAPAPPAPAPPEQPVEAPKEHVWPPRFAALIERLEREAGGMTW